MLERNAQAIMSLAVQAHLIHAEQNSGHRVGGLDRKVIVFKGLRQCDEHIGFCTYSLRQESSS